MNQKYNSSNIFNTALEEHINRIIINQLRHNGELLRAQHHLTRARSFQIDSQQEPEKYKEMKSLALKLEKIAESVTECAVEYALMDIQLVLDEEA
jgi:hypothetical protein